MSITAEKVAAEICLSKGDRPCEADDLHRDGIRTQHCAHCQSTARAILSLLQQGEPEGFLSSVSRTLARSMREILKDIRPEMSVVDRVSLSTTLAVGAMLDLTPLLSASPLPPAIAQGWRPIETAPDFMNRPARQFIRIEGTREHSGGRWTRVWCGEAFIRMPGADGEMLGFRKADIIRLCEDGDMDLYTAKVTHWMPAKFTTPPAEGERK